MNKIFTLDEAEQLDNQKVKELYKKYINPYQTKIFSSFRWSWRYNGFNA